MELEKQIKKYRTGLQLSQEGLAEKIYVTRQTISNWENGKSYPDIHSLLLLSQVFEVSLDQLIKGDMELMKKEVNKEDVIKLKVYSNIFSVLLVAFIIVAAPLIVYLKTYGMIIVGLLYAVVMYYAIQVEKQKKKNNVQTYKEIMAFMNGEQLDEIAASQEQGKRPYQKFMLAMAAAMFMLVMFGLVDLLSK